MPLASPTPRRTLHSALRAARSVCVSSPLLAPRCLSGGAKGRRRGRLASSPRRALSVAAARLAAVVFPAPRRTPRAARSRLELEPN
ncbi:hypothetical protein ZWY2020_033216 [Hordeum vulgare]|nr:hypothetical protein ZWY2020_033216 [Hordeum vulgare]